MRGIIPPTDARGVPTAPRCVVLAVRCRQVAAACGFLPTWATGGTSPLPIARDVPAVALAVASILHVVIGRH